MTEEEKALSGQTYNSADPALCRKRAYAAELCMAYNRTLDGEAREKILGDLLSKDSQGVTLQGPIQFTYGCNTVFGSGCYANFNLAVLDHGGVSIGSNVMFGPNCTILTAVHPLRWQERNMQHLENGTALCCETARKVTVEDNCWIAANVTICPGVTIGAGSVVVDDIPAGVFAAGVPCKVIRKI